MSDSTVQVVGGHQLRLVSLTPQFAPAYHVDEVVAVGVLDFVRGRSMTAATRLERASFVGKI